MPRAREIPITLAKPGDLDGAKANPPFHTNVDNFRFHPDYRIDRILFREIIGTVTGQQRLTKAGQTQQEKGTERLKAVQAQVRSEAHEAKANAAGKAQKSAQNTKEAVNN